ncbi:MAG TPA: hypothetical protein VMM18_04660 [Gemmatimonadaceae bacterium]|nr:hypothetical protein [Gemmatimonadaceae bacterium]
MRSALPLVAGLVLVAIPAAAQEGAPTECVLNPEASPTTRITYGRSPTGAEQLFVGGGAFVRCPERGLTLSSDSAEYYGERRVWYLIGTVRYREPRLSLDSQRLTYWMNEERLLAEGSVVSRLPNGTQMRGPRAEYFRAVAGVRERTRMVAIGRPQFELVETDTAGRPVEPVHLVADHVVMEGDSLVFARGRVEITRPDVLASGDSAALDSGRAWARLMRGPRIEGRGEQPFVLTGTTIDMWSTDRRLERVLSAGEATIDSEDLDLRSDTIDLRLADDRLQRAFAWGRSRARAISSASDILADSLDVHIPNQRLAEVRAVGGAFAQSTPDTSRIRTVERDWMAGDTLIARFDTTAVPPPAEAAPGEPGTDSERTDASRLREILATGGARSYYQLAPEDTTELRPSVNYVVGNRILIYFADGQVQVVTVTEQTFGVLLQPGEPGNPARGNTTAPVSPRPPVPSAPPARPRPQEGPP